MITHNALIIGGTSTASFTCKIIVETSPTIVIGKSKTLLQEHRGISGALVQTNQRRSLIEKAYQIYLVKPTETDINRFTALLSKEQFWLESEQESSVRYWCYRVEIGSFKKDKQGVYQVEATFICHPTRYFKREDRQTLHQKGVLRLQGTALAFPKITIQGQRTGETTVTVGQEVIKLANLLGTVVMDNHPEHPSFKMANGRPIQWSGDFLTIDSSQGEHLGVILDPGISSITFETVWGWV